MPLDKIEDIKENTTAIIKDYQKTFNALNVTPEQREFFFKILSNAFDEICKSDLVSKKDMSIGEGKLNH